MANILNGIDIDRLVETINAIKQNPSLAHFKFRSETEWINGGHSKTTIQGFRGADQEDISREQPFIIEGDEPPILLGENKGPNAVELILASLASCLSVGFVYNAAARGIKIESLRFKVEGDLDLHAFLGLSGVWGIDTRPGYEKIIISYKVKSDASIEKLEELCEYVKKTSPVLDIVCNKVSVIVDSE